MKTSGGEPTAPPRWAMLSLPVGLLLAGGIALSLSFVPFAVARHWVDPFAVDGSADWFTADIFDARIALVRAASVLCLLGAAVLFLARVAVGRWILWLVKEPLGAVRDAGHAMVAWRAGAHPAILLTLVAVTVAGCILRVLNLNAPLRYDEAFTYLTFVDRPLLITISDYSWPNNHILNSLLMRVSTGIFGWEPWGLRLPSFLAGVLMIPATFLAFRRFFGEWAALTGAALVAVSAPLIMFSTNARGYTIVTLCFLLMVALADWVRRGGPAGAWALFAILAALGLWAIPIMLYPTGAIGTWLLLEALRDTRRGDWRAMRHLTVAAAGVIALTCVLYLPVFLHTGPASIVANEAVRPRAWGVFIVELPAMLGALWRTWHDGWPMLTMPVIAAALLALPIAWLARRRESIAGVYAQGLLLLAATVGWCLLLVLITRRAPYLRVWLFMLPLYFAAAGVALAEGVRLLSARRQHTLSAAVVLLMVVAEATSGAPVARARTLPETGIFNEASDVASFLAPHLRKGDGVHTRIPTDAPLVYEFRRHRLAADYLLPNTLERRERILIVVNGAAGQELARIRAGTMLESAYSSPHLLGRIGDASVYETMLIDRAAWPRAVASHGPDQKAQAQ